MHLLAQQKIPAGFRVVEATSRRPNPPRSRCAQPGQFVVGEPIPAVVHEIVLHAEELFDPCFGQMLSHRSNLPCSNESAYTLNVQDCQVCFSLALAIRSRPMGTRRSRLGEMDLRATPRALGACAAIKGAAWRSGPQRGVTAGAIKGAARRWRPQRGVTAGAIPWRGRVGRGDVRRCAGFSRPCIASHVAPDRRISAHVSPLNH